MINTLKKIFIILIIVMIQFTLIPLLAIKGVWPNLILVGIVVWTLMDFSEDALLIACIGGLLSDLAGPTIFGINILFYIGIVFILQYLLKKYISEINLLILLLMTIFITVFYHLYIGLLFHLNISELLIYQCLYNMIITILFYYLLQIFNPKHSMVSIENI